MEKQKKVIKPFTLKDVRIPYNTEHWQPRNFRGLEVGQFNREGARNFCIFLDPAQVDVDQLIEDGWNIKKTDNPKDPMAEPSYMLRVKVRYHPLDSDLAHLNPKIRVISSRGVMMMDEDNVGDLDNAQIMKANMTIGGRWSDTPTYTGITAYLNSMVVRIFEEEGSLDDLMEGIMDD